MWFLSRLLFLLGVKTQGWSRVPVVGVQGFDDRSPQVSPSLDPPSSLSFFNSCSLQNHPFLSCGPASPSSLKLRRPWRLCSWVLSYPVPSQRCFLSNSGASSLDIILIRPFYTSIVILLQNSLKAISNKILGLFLTPTIGGGKNNEI